MKILQPPILLLLAATAATSPLASADCIDSTMSLFRQQASRESVESVATYKLCPNTTLRVSGSVPPSEPPLALFNPNVVIQCGEDGTGSEGGCIVDASDAPGELLVFVSGWSTFASWIPDLPARDEVDIDSVEIVGVTFRGGSQNNIISAGIFESVNVDVTFRDCVFEDNEPEGAGIYLWQSDEVDASKSVSMSFRNCVFHNNVVTEDMGSYLFMNLGGLLRLEDTLIEGNNLEGDTENAVVFGGSGERTDEDGMTYVIRTEFRNNVLPQDSPASTIIASFYSSLSVEDSCFISNSANTNVARYAVGQMDDFTFELENNYGDSATTACSGFGDIKSGDLEDPATWSIECNEFARSYCVLHSAPSASPSATPTATPTTTPTLEPSGGSAIFAFARTASAALALIVSMGLSLEDSFF